MQQGFLNLSGLDINDPTRSQYQLWAFDSGRTEKYPVDCGVFDIVVDGPLVMPISAKLFIKQAFQFAVTEEEPGGVVVSDRQEVVALAQLTL